ncbi:MAG: serine hydroxymethyltransferase [Nanoarchaeota archaeon]|nr:serine hydroxymethyltransferase [Nanoarchaeota archaeon]MBU1269864.1 serine hydroxymethyltransferase [Nanoarchaeota archaeon]MBU1604000.1 serine hydroxymethyltransferase [Nanoarchaeota archaeon]MBU2443289.1 serine hydroxymethyltransferase [Nanoarchaeota archaeon]
MIEQIKITDPQVYEAIKKELQRQRETAELIASENFVSPAVLQAAGSWLTNKYSEGYPDKRYYGGNEFIDVTEKLAIERAKKLFDAEHANVQPHAGSQANMEAYFALLELKDKILGMSLDHGGHLTHGSKVNFSGKFYNFTSYGVDKETGRIDMDEVRKIALREKPKLILAGYSAYSRNLDFREFRKIADEVNAYLMADVAHFAGMIAARKHMMPFPHCDVVTTTTHKTLRGPRGAIILCQKEDRLKEIYHKDSKKNLAGMIDSAVFPGMQGGPLEHVIAAKAVAFGEALKPEFKTYIEQVLKNAKVLAEELMGYGFKLVSDGTDNHLVLVDLTNKGVTGKEAETALDKAGITCNKNMVPFDTRGPFDPSGIRLGTPALTTRGFKESDIREVASAINKVISNIKDEAIKKMVRQDIAELCKKHPLYPEVKL